jgi:hypothetical protein
MTKQALMERLGSRVGAGPFYAGGGNGNQPQQSPQPVFRIVADDPGFFAWAKLLLGTG